jgi:hypothetical protein
MCLVAALALKAESAKALIEHSIACFPMLGG